MPKKLKFADLMKNTIEKQINLGEYSEIAAKTSIKLFSLESRNLGSFFEKQHKSKNN